MQAGVEFSFCEKLQLDCLQGGPWRIQPSRSPKEPDDPVMLPHQLLIHGAMVGSNRSHIDVKDGERQPSLQPLLQKGQYDSDQPDPMSTRHSQRWCSWTTSVDIARPRDCAITFVTRGARSGTVRSSFSTFGS